MSHLKVILPWIKQYLNENLIDPTLNLIEDQLVVYKCIDTQTLSKFHNQNTGRIFRLLENELSEYLPVDSVPFSDDPSSQRKKKELKKLQKQLLKGSSTNSQRDDIVAEDKRAISTQTENPVCLQLKPLHMLMQNISVSGTNAGDINAADSTEIISKKKAKKKKRDSRHEAGSQLPPERGEINDADQFCSPSFLQEIFSKLLELLDSSSIENKGKHIGESLGEIFKKLHNFLQSPSDENKRKFTAEVVRTIGILIDKNYNQIESDNNENVSNNEDRHVSKKRRKNSPDSEIVPSQNPSQESLNLEATEDRHNDHVQEKPLKKKDSRDEGVFEIIDTAYSKEKKKKKKHTESHATNTDDNVGSYKIPICSSNSPKKKKKKKKRKSEGAEIPVPEITNIVGGASFSSSESENLRANQLLNSFTPTSSHNISFDSSFKAAQNSPANSLTRRESSPTKKPSALRSDDFHHELNPTYGSDSDTSNCSSLVLVSHVIGDGVTIKAEPSSPDVADQGLSYPANFVKSPSNRQPPQKSSAPLITSFTVNSETSSSDSDVKVNILHESVNISEAGGSWDSRNPFTSVERPNTSAATEDASIRPPSVPVASTSFDTREKVTEPNECRRLEKELLELEQCLAYAEKDPKDNQQPSTSRVESARNKNPTILSPNSVSSRNHRVQFTEASSNSSTSQYINICEEIGKKIECYKCGETFYSKLELQKHWIDHVKKIFSQQSENQAPATTVERRCSENVQNLPDVCLIPPDSERSQNSLTQSCHTQSIPSVTILYDSQTPYAPNFQNHSNANSIKNKKSSVENLSASNLMIKPSKNGTITFKCSSCGTSFKTAEGLKTHNMKKHAAVRTIGKPFKCPKCPSSSFKTDKGLQKHLAKSSCRKPFKCSKCPTSFKRKSDMNFHLASQHFVKRFTCAVCKVRFRFRRNLIAHRSVHAISKTSNREFSSKLSKILQTKEFSPFFGSGSEDSPHYACYKCGLNFKDKLALMKHWLQHIKEEISKRKKAKQVRIYKCSKCKSKFAKKAVLKGHIVNVCFKKMYAEKRVKCKLCALTFISAVELVDHQLKAHNIDRRHICPLCGLRSTSNSNLHKHIRSHSELRPYKCELCDATFKSKRTLEFHSATHTDARPFECNLCNATFKLRHYLNAHMSKHSTVRSYKCRKCGASFKDRKTLQHHMVMHSNEKPFCCHICNKAFKRKQILKLHMPVHSDEKPFSCDVCDYSAKRLSSIKLHKKRVHFHPN